MARTTKTRSERRREIVETAARLFLSRGYANVSVDMIICEMSVAKGTFYYYFKSKADVLAAIVEMQLDGIVEQAEMVANAPGPDAVSKLGMLLSGGTMGDGDTRQVTEYLHMPENRELHELTNVQTVLRLAPVLAQVVAQGVAEGLFDVSAPLEAVRFLLTGYQFLTDRALFDLGAEETVKQVRAIQEAIERTLGAAPGSFSFLLPSETGDVQ